MVHSVVRRVLSDVGGVSLERLIPWRWPGSSRTGATVSTRLTRSDPTPCGPFTDLFTTVNDCRETSSVEVVPLLGYRSDNNQ